MKPLGIYIHVPFCDTKCPYCDFYSIRGKNINKDNYIKAIKRELSRDWRAQSHFVDTIYFGGGTPSTLSGEQIAEIISCVRDNFNVSDNVEITVECNPSSAMEDVIAAYVTAGVNRVSLGLQSAVESERKGLGRFADRKRISEVLELVHLNGIENVSLDVMIGLPNQTVETLDETLDYCIETGVPHISAYMLQIEEGTVFEKRADKLNLPSDETVGDMYLRMIERLESAGIKQYEISNFAKPGFESRHNLKYWHCEEYLGIGPAAHSFFDGKRFYYERNLPAFEAGSLELVEDGEGGDFEERLMLALRLTEGFKGELPKRITDKVKSPQMADYVILDEDGLRLTKKGFLVSNTIISELI